MTCPECHSCPLSCLFLVCLTFLLLFLLHLCPYICDVCNLCFSPFFPPSPQRCPPSLPCNHSPLNQKRGNEMAWRESCRCLLMCCPVRQPTSKHPHPTSPPLPAFVWRSHLSEPSHAAAPGLWAPFSSCSPSPACWEKSKELGQTFNRTKVKRFWARCASVKSGVKEHLCRALTNLISFWDAFLSSFSLTIPQVNKKERLQAKESRKSFAEPDRERTTGIYTICRVMTLWHCSIWKESRVWKLP